MDVVGDLALLAMHGPVTGFEALANEVLGIGNIAPVETEGAAQVVNHHAALGEILRFGETADGVDVGRTDHVVDGGDVHRSLVIKTFEVSAGLGEIDLVDARAGALLGGHESAVRGLARGLEVGDRALDDAARLAFTDADDVKRAALRELADEDADLGGADFNGADELGSRNHVSKEKNCEKAD